MKYMKRIYITVIIAMTAVMTLASCGNANAKNDEQAQKKAKVQATATVKAKELNSAEFNAKVFDMTKEDLKYLGDKPAIVDFTATWCGPCQRIAPILDELAKEYDGKIVVYKVDIDKNQELAKAFGISSIPAILYIPLNGEPTMTVGSRDKAKFKTEVETILLAK